MLHTHLHLHVGLTRRTSALSQVTLEKAVLSEVGQRLKDSTLSSEGRETGLRVGIVYFGEYPADGTIIRYLHFVYRCDVCFFIGIHRIAEGDY